MRRSVANLLRTQGFSPVDEASSVSEALEKAADVGGYDLVLSDWNMDPRTGLDLLISVRSELTYENTVFVLMTAEPTDEKRAAAEAAGVSGFLVKPFGAETLVSEIEKFFGVE
ncbi:MAG: response regulator [Rhodospirillaceae bacterium]|nr:response regulator [Rhodospirillaceae bacterium]MBT5242590.1 response regulator [Rhodospirillaceae bacterium]MBT5566101.1 response regulator [Rhodospirillaceae bacterium]MBT6090642.1 response regulator [Rhodospirillaceae bacterium]MBT7450427.1 response regulator [Rhodospirillaceae bacterium]